MSTDPASIGKMLISFIAGVVVTAVSAASIWPRPAADQGTPLRVDENASVARGRHQANDVEPGQASRDAEKTEACKVAAEYARSIMDGRQHGVAMSRVMDLAKEADPAIAPLLTRMVVDAYDRPRMAVERNRETAVRDFENEAFLTCVKQTR